VAGRDTVIIDFFYSQGDYEILQARYWIDARTGVALRLRTYLDNELRTPGNEIRVMDIRYDLDFPPELFDPNARHIDYFAADPNGTPQDRLPTRPEILGLVDSSREILPKRAPPPDFDPSQSQLTFQFTGLIRLGAARDMAEVFAGGYYLGMLAFADPWNVNCARSPNGRYIAYHAYMLEEPYRSSLRWFDLLDLAKVHDPIPEILPSWSNLAFAPDSGQLAFIGCWDISSQDCSLYVLDLPTGEPRRLTDIADGLSLAWSPDGRQIAFIGTFALEKEYQLHIIDARTGEITYIGPFDWGTNQPSDPQSPLLSWNLPFPNWSTDLASCSAPP